MRKMEAFISREILQSGWLWTAVSFSPMYNVHRVILHGCTQRLLSQPCCGVRQFTLHCQLVLPNCHQRGQSYFPILPNTDGAGLAVTPWGGCSYWCLWSEMILEVFHIEKTERWLLSLQRKHGCSLPEKGVPSDRHPLPHKGDLHIASHALSQNPSRVVSCFECFSTVRNVHPDFILRIAKRR